MKRAAVVGGIVVGSLALACGKIVGGDDAGGGPWEGTQSGGVTAAGPTYPPLPAASQTPSICNQGALVGGSDDACLAAPVTCSGAAPSSCQDYSSPDDLIGGGINNDGSSFVEGGIGHYHAPSASDQVYGVTGSTAPAAFKISTRMKVSAATGSVTLLRARVQTTDYREQSATLELTGSRLRMCSPGRASGNPVCADVGTFGRDVWHTIVFSLVDGTVAAQLDCLPPVKTQFDIFGTPDPRSGVSIDYGIMWPTCASDVDIDIVRSD